MKASGYRLFLILGAALIVGLVASYEYRQAFAVATQASGAVATQAPAAVTTEGPAQAQRSEAAQGENSSSAGGLTFHGYGCTVDCSGHEAGYNWAEEHDITDKDDCPIDPHNSHSFTEGCWAYADGQSSEDNDQDSP